jgi:hypothetical protein
MYHRSLQTSKTLNYADNIPIVMTLSLNCKDAGDPICTHTVYGETEEEVLQNAKKHGKDHSDACSMVALMTPPLPTVQSQ